eukprot:10779202-Ditylum_brightwellii.AAC.1
MPFSTSKLEAAIDGYVLAGCWHAGPDVQFYIHDVQACAIGNALFQPLCMQSIGVVLCCQFGSGKFQRRGCSVVVGLKWGEEGYWIWHRLLFSSSHHMSSWHLVRRAVISTETYQMQKSVVLHLLG